MTFSDPRCLWGLWAVPVALLLELWAARRARGRLQRLVGDRPDHALLAQRDPREVWVNTVLRSAALACLAVGAAGPEWGREIVRRASSGSDAVLLVDVSASMDSRDVPPSRIDEARREALATLDRLSGSRVGVVAFAGDAVRLCPLTLDVGTAHLVVESLSSGSLSTPGTDLGRGLSTALRMLPGGRRSEQAIVLWTDGEDLERGARAAIDAVADAGVRVLVVGVGTPQGDVVPVMDGEGRVMDVKRDAGGAVVRSRLDEDLLRTLARRTRGAYFSARRPGGELGRLLAAVDGLARGGRAQRLVERPVARFPLLAGVAVVLLVIERGRRRQRRVRRREPGTELRSERTAAAAALLVASLLAPAPARAESAWSRGNRAFRAGRYAEADSLYGRRLARGGPDEVRVNRATARALAGRTQDGENELERLSAENGKAAGTASYNLGTLRGKRGDDEAAMQALRSALDKDPADDDARFNYEVLLRRQKQSQNPQQPPRNQGGGGGGGTPPPSPSQPGPEGQAPAPAPTPPAGPRPSAPTSGMTREQGERLLNALEEMARAEQRGRREVRATRERRGRDW